MGRQFGTEVLLPNADPTTDNHASRKKYVDDQDATAVHKTGDETVNGVKTIPSGSGNSWIFNQPPQVAVGTAVNHPVRRDDARLTDARTPVAHGHSGEDITSGTISANRLPAVLQATSNNTTTDTSSYSIDMTAITYPFRVRVLMNHNSGLVAPSGTVVDGQVVKIAAYANTAQRTFTFGSTIALSTGLSSRVFTVPAGKVLIAAIEYNIDLAAWVLTAATVSA